MILLFRHEKLVGVHPQLLKFFFWWAVDGPFPLTITEGVRNDPERQRQLYRDGKSKAKTLAQTPHGAGMAVDAYPAIPNKAGTRCIAIHDNVKKPESKALFDEYGMLAEAHGLVWGGKFKNFYDGPHVEVPNWRKAK